MMAISPVQLLIIALIVVLLFGTKKLRSLGSDLGAAVKGFKKSVSDDDDKAAQPALKNEQADADFAPKSISEQTADIKSDETKSQNKEQV